MKTVLYAPAIYRNDKGLWPPTTPSTWYYRWQKQLWDFFEFQEGLFVRIIWKAGPRTSNLDDPIKNLQAKNIRYSTKKIERELKKCDVVLVDFPSSPMLDAQKAGKECYCITPFDKQWIRDDCKDDIIVVSDFREFKIEFIERILKLKVSRNEG